MLSSRDKLIRFFFFYGGLIDSRWTWRKLHSKPCGASVVACCRDCTVHPLQPAAVTAPLFCSNYMTQFFQFAVLWGICECTTRVHKLAGICTYVHNSRGQQRLLSVFSRSLFIPVRQGLSQHGCLPCLIGWPFTKSLAPFFVTLQHRLLTWAAMLRFLHGFWRFKPMSPNLYRQHFKHQAISPGFHTNIFLFHKNICSMFYPVILFYCALKLQ